MRHLVLALFNNFDAANETSSYVTIFKWYIVSTLETIQSTFLTKHVSEGGPWITRDIERLKSVLVVSLIVWVTLLPKYVKKILCLNKESSKRALIKKSDNVM